ncbi:HAMP domain-containing sensor histidine kinase [Streptomyces sp. NPDC050732]|uniref:HAMP domain-containing sensor histidine kinase n=1 Tax=Streptomyces sp. NPDC050732 TaxID=3154632 RepID=UPI00342B8BE9
MRDVPLRKSLLARLLAVSVLVSIGSIAATAWLAAQTTSGALRQEQGQVLADDARIYDRLLGVGASAPQWRGADKAVRELSRSTGRRIALTTQDRKVIADSAARRTALPPTASAVLDPLSVDATLAPGRADEGTVDEGTADEGTAVEGTAVDRIDPRAVGPYRLPEQERAALKEAADRSAACLTELGMSPEVVSGTGGRPFVRLDYHSGEFMDSRCRMSLLDVPTAHEQKALDKLNSLSDACMKRRGLAPVPISLDLTARPGPKPIGAAPTSVPVAPRETPPVASPAAPVPDPVFAPTYPEPDTSGREAIGREAIEREAGEPTDAAIRSCVDTARREQLGPYVSSPALLFITSSDGTRSTPGFSLSRANTSRLAGLAAAVLAVTVAVTALAATRLTRPLRALTTATRRMKAGEPTEPVPERVTRSAGEISQLAAAFNDMAAHRKALEEQRKAMVSDVAHELRTPLSNIRGWLEAAEDGVVDTDPELVTSLLEEALLLQHIVDDLQDLAAADAGTLRLHREPVRAAEIADQVAAAHQARADAAGVKLRATAFGDPWVTADPLRLRQAVGNLVSNAVRHTPEGGNVRISCRTTSDAVLIEVADTGTGIAPADLPHVFDRFWRADKSRTRATGGSGLGLSIVRKLVEAHDGTVSAESVPGKGSLFTVRLPGEQQLPGQ